MNVRSPCPLSPTVMGGKSLSGSCYWSMYGNDKIFPLVGPAEGSRRGLKSPRPYQSIFPKCDVENIQTTSKPQAGRHQSPGCLLPGTEAVSQRHRWNRTASLPTSIVLLTLWGFCRLVTGPRQFQFEELSEDKRWGSTACEGQSPFRHFPSLLEGLLNGRPLLSSHSAVLACSQPFFFRHWIYFASHFCGLWGHTYTATHACTHTPQPPFCSPPSVCRIYRLWCLETQSLSPLLSPFLLLLPAKACCCLLPSRKPLCRGARFLATSSAPAAAAAGPSQLLFPWQPKLIFPSLHFHFGKEAHNSFLKEKKNWATSGIVNLDCTEFLAPPTPLVSWRPSPTFLYLPPPLPHPMAPDSKAGLRGSLGEFFVSLN